jgi:5-methylcytosine-specific restriction protein A
MRVQPACANAAGRLRRSFEPMAAPYLEAHHIRRLTDGGPDDPRFMIALCPNCHRQAHSGKDKLALNVRMLKIVEEKETSGRP